MKLVHLSSETAIQAFTKCTNARNGRTRFCENCRKSFLKYVWHTKWVFLKKWCGIFETINACTTSMCKICNAYRKVIILAGQILWSGSSGWEIKIHDFRHQFYLVMKQHWAETEFLNCALITFGVAPIPSALPLVITTDIFREHLYRYPWLFCGRPLHLTKPFDRHKIPYLLGTSASQFVECYSTPHPEDPCGLCTM